MDLKNIAEQLNQDSREKGHDFSGHFEGFREDIVKALLFFMDAMFPGYVKLNLKVDEEDSRHAFLEIGTGYLLSALKKTNDKKEAEEKAERLVNALPGIFSMLKKDVVAGYEGDPACKSTDEVILAYPAFLAIGIYRIAHELYLMGETLIARIMTEYAHRKTGIDIHPGASIDEYFFIDHGTGVVIGETTVIGKHVKLYQHVTLGAKSFPVHEDGTLVKGIKRHPNVGDHVVIYAGATILGGDVTIGDHSVIGGNVWLTHSVEPGTTVTQRQE